MGLGSAGGTKVPSKSLEYMLVNLPLEEGPGNIFADALCLSLMFLADLALSLASLTVYCRSAAASPGSGVSLALAEPARLSRVLGRFTGSAMPS